MIWSDETVGMVALAISGAPFVSKKSIGKAMALLATVEQSKEWRDRFNGETELNLSESKEINVYGTEAKYLSDEIERLKADREAGMQWLWRII